MTCLHKFIDTLELDCVLTGGNRKGTEHVVGTYRCNLLAIDVSLPCLVIHLGEYSHLRSLATALVDDVARVTVLYKFNGSTGRIIVLDRILNLVLPALVNKSNLLIYIVKRSNLLIRIGNPVNAINKPALAESVAVENDIAGRCSLNEILGVEHVEHTLVALAYLMLDKVLITREFGRTVSAN